MYKPGLISGKSIFKIIIERFIKVQMVAHGISSFAMAPLNCKLFICTQDKQREDIINYFEKQSYFGLKKEHVVFFSDHLLPALTIDGNILMKERGSIHLEGGGSGAFVDAIHRNPELASIIEANCDFV